MKREEIKTKTALDLPPIKMRKQELVKYLTELTVNYLRSAYASLFGKPAAGTKKNELVDETADALNFPSGEEFRAWFYGLPVLTQKILYRTAFTDYVPIPCLEKEWGRSLLVQDRRFSWQIERHFNPGLRLDFLLLHTHCGCPVAALPAFLQALISLWLVPPPLFQVSACRVSEPADNASEAPWNNSRVISEVFPLLCDALGNMPEEITEGEREKILRGGFKKKAVTELRTSTGFASFTLGGDYGPDSVDLAARFILCMYNDTLRRPDDGQHEIRNMATAFFSEESRYSSRWRPRDRAYLEYTICLDHLVRTPGCYLNDSTGLPAARKVFYDILLHIARDGGWFDADKLAEHIRIAGRDFAFCDKHLEKTLKLKAETLEIEGLRYSDVSFNGFYPEGILRYYLLVRPLFKAYGYIFAVLGMLEIVQSMPPLSRVYREKQYPLSPYDSLKSIRITEFGRWCLGLTAERPPKPAPEYHAIADRELFLVTVQGNPLEPRVYLDKIGRRLGEDRWRISPASFIRGCINPRQIIERIERFKALIDPNPAPHWERLFQKVLDRAGLFDVNRSDMVVYDLPENQEILEELLQDPELKHIARLAEGKLLVVASKDQRKFFALLSEHGIAHF